MIKNIVFDLGNVLIEFNPQAYLKRIQIPEEHIQVLVNMIFKDVRWNEFDRGTIELQKYIYDLKLENNKYANYIDIIFADGWESKMFKLKENTSDFLKEVSKSKKVFILSNVSEQVLNYVKKFDFWKNVDGGTYSYVVKHCKPEDDIYINFLQDNQLKPEECLFLDDKLENIQAAKKFGMHGIVFNGDFNDNKKEINSIIYGKF